MSEAAPPLPDCCLGVKRWIQDRDKTTQGDQDGLAEGGGATRTGVSGSERSYAHILPNRIPYTMAKFVVYEKVAEAIYQKLPKKDMSDGMQTTVNLGSGLIAGFAAALVSQPADTMLSKINKTKGLPGEGTTTRLIKIGKELGLRGSYTGIGARLFMVGTLTAFQFAIYGKLYHLILDSSSSAQRLTSTQAT